MEKSADKLDELLRAWNSKGEYLGKLDRKQVHEKGFWHREASLIVLSPQNHIMIIKRSYNKASYPGAWGLIAGHVVNDETGHASAFLEGEEELPSLGLVREFLLSGDHNCICKDMENEREDNRALVTSYLVRPKNLRLDISMFQAEEISGIQFISLQDLKEMIDRENPKESIFKKNKYYQVICDYIERYIAHEKNPTSIKKPEFSQGNIIKPYQVIKEKQL